MHNGTIWWSENKFSVLGFCYFRMQCNFEMIISLFVFQNCGKGNRSFHIGVVLEWYFLLYYPTTSKISGNVVLNVIFNHKLFILLLQLITITRLKQKLLAYFPSTMWDIFYVFKDPCKDFFFDWEYKMAWESDHLLYNSRCIYWLTFTDPIKTKYSL